MPKETSVPGLFGALAGVAALFLAAVAIIVTAGDDGTTTATTATAGPVAVSLAEFSITPAAIQVPSGEPVVIQATNDGSATHNLVLVETGDRTSDLQPGDGGTLDLGVLDDGTYTLICDIPGHQAAGMEATLTVGGDGAGAHDHTEAAGSPMSFEEMDRVMKERTDAFPAETEGKGAQPLEPQILADGTKQFELTTSNVDWEVEPGKVVRAMAYNGQVPGPTIKVDVGDKVRIVLHNEMDESTTIHFHGIDVPNDQDGVPDITQPPVAPGQSWTYEFTTTEPAVGIYHSHHHGEVQVPNGLFAAFLVGDMPVPPGTDVVQELPLVVNDAGTIGFSINGKSFPATEPIVVRQGESVLIHYLNEGLQPHPMHLHGPDQLVVAKDGNPLPQPYLADTINVSPGERYTVLVTAERKGVWAFHCHILTHAEREDGMFGMVTAMIVE